MEIGSLAQWLSAAAALLAVGLSLRALRVAASQKLREDIQSGDEQNAEAMCRLSDKVTALDRDLDRRLTTLEGTVRAMPTHEDVRAIWTQLRAIGEQVSATAEVTRALGAQVRDIHHYLLHKETPR